MSFLARLSLANRGLTALIALVVVGAGLLVIPSLRQQLFPTLSLPAVTVSAAYPGAAPGIVEDQVTKPIEDSLRGIDGLSSLKSTSHEGYTVVELGFDYGTDIEKVATSVESTLNKISAQLPVGVDPSVVTGSTDDIPAIILAASSDASQRKLAATLAATVVPKIKEIEGVRDVQVGAAGTRQVVITPDLEKLAAAKIDVLAISSALQENGISIPAGNVTEKGRSLSVQIGSALTTLKQIRGIYLMPTSPQPGSGAQESSQPDPSAEPAASAQPTPSGQPDPSAEPGPGTSNATPSDGAGSATPVPIKLADVASVKEETVPAPLISRTNSRPSLDVSVTATRDANAVAISNEVRDLLPELTETLGEGASLNVVFDQAPYVQRSLESLATEGLLGLIFAVLVVLVFLASVRSTLVTAVSIPLSVLVALIALRGWDYSLNLLTLAGLTIAVGRVVDDSIVVLENIKEHLASGEERRAAVLTAVNEVAGAVTASTLTTVVVFAPMGLVGGLIGELFAPFAVTVTVALIASLLVSLTVVPVLAYWFVKSDGGLPRARHSTRRTTSASLAERIYRPVIEFATRRRFTVLSVSLLILVLTVGMAGGLKTNFLDSADETSFGMQLEMPVGTSLDATDAAAKKVEAVLADADGVESYQAIVGAGGPSDSIGVSNHVQFWVTMREDAKASAVIDNFKDSLNRLVGSDDVGELSFSTGGGGVGGNQIKVAVQGADQKNLSKAVKKVQKAVAGIADVKDVTNDFEGSAPRAEVVVNRGEAAKYGLTEAGIGQIASAMFRGTTLGQLTIKGERQDVVLRVGKSPATVKQVRELLLPTAAGEVPLEKVAKVKKVAGPVQVTRVDGERSITVTGTAKGGDIGAITKELTSKLEDLKLPAGVSYSIGGVSADQGEAFKKMIPALVAAVAIVFLIMAATFGSLLQPLILMVSVPFASIGAVGVLLITDTALGVPALIGLLMLVGIVVTNAIVLMDLINQYRRQGMDIRQAVIEGGCRRLRPILMTAVATICALLPMGLGITGHGGFISQPLAVVVIGGLLSSTVLTLVLVPTLYTMVEYRRERRRAGAADGGRQRRGRRHLRDQRRRRYQGPVPWSGDTYSGDPSRASEGSSEALVQQ